MAEQRGSEFSRINDPNFLIEVAVGPPVAQLTPQQPGTGPRLGGQYHNATHRYIFKKAHMSNEDFRIFDGQSGALMCVLAHEGKNPYGSLDPLGFSNAASYNGPFGEWASMARVAGYNGMPSFKIRPKTLSRHGRQYIQDPQGRQTFFNIAKQSRFKTMSIRHNLEVCQGDTDKEEYSIWLDLAGRTIQIVNGREERLAHIEKSMQTLIMNAALGHGSEMTIDVAAGVDWTAVLAIVMGIQQVGKHFVKDALGNFVVNPLQNQAQDAILEATGTEQYANQAGHMMDQGLSQLHWFQRLQQIYFH
ncbi:hypothetical protein WJX72_007473 [[Myrmecia] bisecta]|uniref:Uncharacterized protein n=1 Tax=[Myrmecia] bisecta TaxID=41462 RepID=A0AAW1QAZ3_9CHLO